METYDWNERQYNTENNDNDVKKGQMKRWAAFSQALKWGLIS